MAASFGKNVKVTVFGQSHSEAIGCVVDGIPAGLTLDMAAIDAHMQRRAPGAGNSQADSKTITARSETDQPHIVSGIVDGVTCGAPICAIIENKDQRSKDYSQFKACPRPSHADYPAFLKYSTKVRRNGCTKALRHDIAILRVCPTRIMRPKPIHPNTAPTPS